MKKKTGGDSTSVSSTKRELIGGKKKTDNSTSYNKKNTYHRQSAPDYPYGQQHLSKSMAKPGSGKTSASSTKKK